MTNIRYGGEGSTGTPNLYYVIYGRPLKVQIWHNVLWLKLTIDFDANADSKLRTHLTKQDSKELRVGKERVSCISLKAIMSKTKGNDYVHKYDLHIGEGGGAGRGRGVRLPMCWDFTKPLQRTL